jgi:nucleoside-diphosphate-sugar epimerase
MKIGITGATGTLGRRLKDKLIDRGNHVVALCRNKDSAKTLLNSSLVEIAEGDITTANTLYPFIKDLDVCIHLAAQVDHADKDRYWNVNVNGTNNLCDAIMQGNPKCRLVYCSSIAVLRFDKMKTDYSLSKARGEEIVRSMMNKMAATIIYSGLIFGPGDQRFIPHLIKGLQAGNIPLVGGGESWAPVIYIDDLCELFIKVAESEYAIGKSFLGIQQTSAGIHDFIKIVARQCGYPVPGKKVSRSLLLLVAILMEWWNSIPLINKKSAISKRIVDILSINYRSPSFENEKKLGWQPVTTMEAGINAFLSEAG